jgi:hypothetical protein
LIDEQRLEVESLQCRRSRTIAALALVLMPTLASTAQGQWGFWKGDSLLALGRLASAESAYYAAVRQRPRDPVVRAALGRFLAARGATRVGAVLIEEARQFGGDSAALARALVPMYARLGDFAAIDTLRPAVISPVERRRSRWLRDHPPSAAFRDSIVILSYRPTADGQGLGTVMVRIGKTQVPAVIDPRASGIVVPRAMLPELRSFGEGSSILGIVDAARIGGIVFNNMPATLDAQDTRVRVGFDVLAPYSPTFDPRRGLLTLRKPERRSQPQPGARVPTLYDASGVRLLIGDGWQPSSAAMPAMLLATRSWMWDGRRGDIVFLSP